MSDAIKAAKADAWDEALAAVNFVRDEDDARVIRDVTFPANPYREVVIDELRLRDAIYQAIVDRIGPSAAVAPGIVTDIIRNYERD